MANPLNGMRKRFDSLLPVRILKRIAIENNLDLLPEAAMKSEDGVNKLLTHLFRVAGEDETLKGIIIDRIIAALLVVALKNRHGKCLEFLKISLKIVGKDDVLKEKIIKGAFAVLPVMMETSPLKGNSIIGILFEAAGENQVLRNIIVDNTLILLPVVAKKDLSGAGRLVGSLIRAAGENEAQKGKIIKNVFAILTMLPMKPGSVVHDYWIKQVAQAAGVPINVLSNMFGHVKTPDGKVKVYVSGQGGRNDHISVALKKPDAPVKFITGCFRGTAKELTQMSRENHGEGTEHYRHYQNVIAAADAAFKRPLRQPIGEIALRRIAAYHAKHPSQAVPS